MDTTRRKMYLLALLSVAIIGSCGQIITVPNKTGVLGNNPVTLTCSYSSTTSLSGVVLWSKKVVVQNQDTWPYLVSFPVPPTNNNSTFNPDLADALKNRLTYDRFASDTSTDITFTSILCEDASDYRCEITTFPAGGDVATMTLTVEVMPVTAPTVASAATAPYISGQTYTFTCGGDVGSPSATITWYIQRTNIIEQIITQGVTGGVDSPAQTCSNTRISTLEITMVNDDNSANIYCKVSHTLLQNDLQSAMIQLDVQYAVTVKLVTRVPDVTQYIIGTDVQLTCHADGNPTPEFYWQYKPLGGDDATNITNSNGKTLFLNDLQLGDSGVYSCIAENTLGGVAYNGTYPTNIDVVATTTPAPATTQSSTEIVNPTTVDPATDASTGSNTSTILAATLGTIGGLLVIAIIIGVYCFMIRRKKPQRIEEPPEKPRNDRPDLGYNIRPDVVVNGEKQKQPNYNNAFDKTGEQLYYASLQFDNEPRSRKPLAGSGDTNYADISTMPRV